MIQINLYVQLTDDAKISVNKHTCAFCGNTTPFLRHITNNWLLLWSYET